MLSKLESRKECMEQIELIQHWNYFCSLAERLDDTKHYIDHGLQEHDGIRELVHEKVYSDIFKQIIVLAASEFEIMSKALCSAKGVKTKRIGDISETILGVFPKIIDFEVSTPFWINTPLHDWKTTRIDNGKNVKVEGLDWWFAYNSIKHDEKESIKNATFENAVLALASLYIIEIYLMKELFGNIPVIIAPNSVDMSLFFIRDKKECRQRLGLPENQFIVGFVGGFVERKGDKRLLSAINSLEGVYGAFAGRGDESPKGEKVVFCEALQHEEIPIFLNAVDVFCLPTQNEGSCNAIVEAAACAKPIISSNLPFNDDLLTDDNSIRIDPNSVDEIRRGIEVLYNDIDYCKKIGEAVYQDSRQFDIEIRAQKIVNFIKRTMRNRYDKE